MVLLQRKTYDKRHLVKKAAMNEKDNYQLS